MHIQDVPSISDLEKSDFEEFAPFTPQGLAAVRDSLEIREPPRIAPKPNIVTRTILAISIVILQVLTMTIQCLDWVLKNIFGLQSREKKMYQELYHISKSRNLDQIKSFLRKHATPAYEAGYLFGELLAIDETHIHLMSILEGANVAIVNDNGFFCKKWRQFPESYQRISSHAYRGEECYAIGHFLFWIDLDGNTRFQFENSPLQGFFSTVDHIFDYLRYRRDNEQQGVAGSSGHTEEYCLEVEVNMESFREV